MAPLRIMHVIPNLRRGGAERMALDIVRALSRHPNVEASLVVLEEQNEYPELTAEIDIQRTTSWFRPSLWKANKADLRDLQLRITQFDPHVIHTHLFQADFLVRMTMKEQYPIFTHFHDNMPQYLQWTVRSLVNKKALTNYYERHLLKRTLRHRGNRFIAISRHTEAYMQKVLNRYQSRIRLLPNAIDLNRFTPVNNNDNRKSKTVRLINVGSFVPKKNQQFLINVMQYLPDNYVLIFLGDGSNRVNVEQMAMDAGLSHRITFKGNVPNPEEYLQDSDLYVHSATYEPFGLVLVEAMACGLPVVALDGGGNRDIVKAGGNGFLLTKADPAAFANQIERLIDNPSLYQSLREGALQSAQQYSMAHYTERLLALYREAIAAAGPLQTVEN